MGVTWHVSALLTFLVGLVICVAVYALGTILTALVFRLPIQEVGLFHGPSLFQFQVGDTTVRINCLPFAAYVRLKNESYYTASLVAQICLNLLGHGTVFVLAAVCLGWEPAVQSFVAAFEQILRGAIHPLSEGRDYVNAAIAFLGDHGFREGLGATGAKLFSINVIPLPPLSGGMALIAVFESAVTISESTRGRVYLIGFLILLTGIISWIVAVLAALFS